MRTTRRGPRQRTALDDLLSAQRKGILDDTSEISSCDELNKQEECKNTESENEQSDVSLKLSKRTGDYDKDIDPSPKVPKSTSGKKVKRSHSTTSLPIVKPGLSTEDTYTDSSEVFLPCSGTVASKIFYLPI